MRRFSLCISLCILFPPTNHLPPHQQPWRKQQHGYNAAATTAHRRCNRHLPNRTVSPQRWLLPALATRAVCFRSGNHVILTSPSIPRPPIPCWLHHSSPILFEYAINNTTISHATSLWICRDGNGACIIHIRRISDCLTACRWGKAYNIQQSTMIVGKF